jgi:hypothetical protein
MKNIIYYTLLLFLISNSAKSQEWVDLNLIITINGTISPGSIALKMNYVLKNGEFRKIDLNYTPGSLKIKKTDLDEIEKDSVVNLNIDIRHTKICKDNISYSNYIIDDFKFNWLKNDFFILHIYDLNDKKNKKFYNPLPNKNFTYEYDSPAGSMRQVQKRKTVEQKQCE